MGQRRGRYFSRSPTGWIVRPRQWNVSQVSNLLSVQTTCFLTPESALYTICFLARLNLSLSFGVQAHHLLTFVPTILPTFSKQYYKTHQPFFLSLKPSRTTDEQQQIRFVLMWECLSSIVPTGHFQFCLFFPSCSYFYLLDKDFPGHLSQLHINLVYDCWFYKDLELQQSMPYYIRLIQSAVTCTHAIVQFES